MRAPYRAFPPVITRAFSLSGELYIMALSYLTRLADGLA